MTKGPQAERRSDDRMQALLDAALDVFARDGYRTATIDHVAEAAGVTKGAVYHYFDTKEALLLRVIERSHALAFGRAEEALRDGSLPASTRIRLLVRKVFSERSAGSDRLLGLLVRSVAHEVPRAHERWLREGPARLWTLLGRLVEEGKARGEFRPDADGDVGARVLVSGLMLQLLWQQHVRAVPAIAVDADRLIDSSVDLFLAGLRATGPAAPPSRPRRRTAAGR
ncbi:MAG TPA: TetR/AcrR family transcriptional regulator [Gemmatimonadaceae bacterium]|jgi:AcrR family transcriptional regulator|nr:TetR/AcrR family transcriptional regulator [Gemmatimonadaceae bacterium]